MTGKKIIRLCVWGCYNRATHEIRLEQVMTVFICGRHYNYWHKRLKAEPKWLMSLAVKMGKTMRQLRGI